MFEKIFNFLFERKILDNRANLIVKRKDVKSIEVIDYDYCIVSEVDVLKERNKKVKVDNDRDVINTSARKTTAKVANKVETSLSKYFVEVRSLRKGC